ncbi:peptidoglycan DD-metalloendopeptidase family protein [candidate division KSB1 bacterium]|nr:peptidoglycan DD-metalloendopeptidase family protein [candidate division KSB1 bacterium]
MKLRRVIILLLNIELFCAILALGQDVSADKKAQLRQQIDQYRDEINRQEKFETSAKDLLDDIQQEMGLTRALVRELQKEEVQKKQEIQRSEDKLVSLENELEKLKSFYTRRLVFLYKHGRTHDLEIILQAKSFNQALTWIKYQKMLLENDQRNIKNIQKKRIQIQQEREHQKKIWQETRALLDEKNVESKHLADRKKKQEHLITQIRKDKPTYLKKIREAENSLTEIEQIIKAQEKRRRQAVTVQQQQVPEYSNFPELKKRMIWPIKGKVIKAFGNIRHPELKTVTRSLGIDIKATPGSEIVAVADGVVARIQWFRGIGTLILVNHHGGYYTVYANVGDVFIDRDEQVQIGQVIGTVGEAGVDNIPKVHFEIWNNNEAVDPMKWLR